MSPNVRYFTGVAAVASSILLLVGCGGGGGGGDSDTTARGTTATVTLANHMPAEEEAGAAAFPASADFGFGWRPVRVREILSLTVSITEIYFQYCNDPGSGMPEVVLVNESAFDPPSITIKEGETVRWEWTSDTEHTITSGGPGNANAGNLFHETAATTGAVVELTFADCGVFPYFSNTEADIAAGMSGIVRVKKRHGHHVEAAAPPTGAERHGGGHFGERVMIFSGEFDIDLLNLTDLSQILTTADVPAESYCRIFIRLENPRLVLASDPETVITDVHLTSNGRLFLKERFSIMEDEEILVLLDFGGIHLYRRHGGYVLSPRLRADIRVIDADMEIEGAVLSIDTAMKSFEVETEEGSILDVFVDRKTAILTDDDADDSAPAGAVVKLRFNDLAAGQQVRVLGTMDASAVIEADSVEVGDEEIDTTL